MKTPEHSLAAMEKFPAPDRKYYFTGKDYAMACMRVHEKRIKYDKLCAQGKPA